MAWLPSHQELRSHPKTVKAARMLGVGVPQVIGHLHLLWWWALDHAPDGDLSRFDADDIALAAWWQGNEELFVHALRNCGPGDSCGFLSDDQKLHDWNEYGGKYTSRVESARKAANARWDASAMRTHSERNAGGNAEKSREEKKEQEPASRKRADRAHRLPDGWQPEPEPALLDQLRIRPTFVQQELDKFRDYWLAQPGARGRKVNWQATWRNWLRRAVEIQPQAQGPERSRPRVLEVGSSEWEAEQTERMRLYEQLTGRSLS